jgi:hypothetical protein
MVAVTTQYEDLEEGVVILEMMSEGQELVWGPSGWLSLLCHHQVQHPILPEVKEEG